MNHGIVLPSGDARAAADFASEAETHGWDGFFVWEPVWGVDAWVQLAAAAMQTHTIRLGTLLSPISRMRPWELASKVATLDNLSNGRVILSVGLGAVDSGFESFAEETDIRVRAELLDEGLEIMTGLFRGQPYAFHGKHYHVEPTTFPIVPPPPVQRPHPKIWVVGHWPTLKSMRRVARYDGLLPSVKDMLTNPVTPEQLHEMTEWINANRVHDREFDFVVEGQTPGMDGAADQALLESWREAGATWWIESMWDADVDMNGPQAVLDRIRRGPAEA